MVYCKIRPVSSDAPKLGDFLSYWLKDIVQPNLAPKTYQTYELFVRLHIVPHLGQKRIDQLQVKDIRQWINKLTRICQYCAQGKDAARPVSKRRCCAIGKCCHRTLSPQSRKDARATFRAALTCAVEEEIIARNPVAVIRLPAPRKSKRCVWSVDEARRFLESVRDDCDPHTPPTFSSSSWACARARYSGLPGIGSISTPPSCTSASNSSGSRVRSSGVRSRPNRQKHRCRCPSYALRH